jgi:hypothetical protein
MAERRLRDHAPLIVLWLGLPLLVGILYHTGGRLHEGWQARPATEVETTDCRIEAMMGGDNPVEIRRIERQCLEEVNAAYTAPRVGRLLLAFSSLVMAYAAVAAFLTWRHMASDP